MQLSWLSLFFLFFSFLSLVFSNIEDRENKYILVREYVTDVVIMISIIIIAVFLLHEQEK